MHIIARSVDWIQLTRSLRIVFSNSLCRFIYEYQKSERVSRIIEKLTLIKWALKNSIQNNHYSSDIEMQESGRGISMKNHEDQLIWGYFISLTVNPIFGFH